MWDAAEDFFTSAGDYVSNLFGDDAIVAGVKAG